jgi:cell division inhibitor SepF
VANGFFNKFKNMFGLNEEMFEEDDDAQDITSLVDENLQQYSDAQEEVPYKKRKVNRAPGVNTNIIDFSSTPANEMIVVEPNSYDDAIKIVSLLKSKVAVIISFINSTLSHEDTMHIIDFICGAVCAIDGNQKIVAPGVYLFTPGNININSMDSEQPQSKMVDKSGNNLFLTINDITFNKKKTVKVS